MFNEGFKMKASRIPEFVDTSIDSVSMWFAEMSVRELLFDPDDAPETIGSSESGGGAFTAAECVELKSILDRMFERYGDAVYEAAYPVFMKSEGIRLDA